jgi:hypothetical protein
VEWRAQSNLQETQNQLLDDAARARGYGRIFEVKQLFKKPKKGIKEK